MLSPFGVATQASIKLHPKDAFVYKGGSATFVVGFDIPPPATLTSIKWQKNGVDIPDSNASSITLNGLTSADNNSKIKAIITYSNGTLTSNEATLYVSEFTNEFAVGVVKFEAYHNISGTAVEALKAESKFPASPDNVQLLTAIDTPNGYGENYGARVTGFIVPPKTASYNFFIRSDDASELFISSNETPPDVNTATPVAAETGCCAAFLEPGDGVEETTAIPIAMVAGRKYAFVALLKEAGGGDYLQVAAREDGVTTPAAASLTPLTGKWIGANAKPSVGTVQITKQPVGNTQLIEERAFTLSVEASVVPTGYGYPVLVQWKKNGTDIPGATGLSYVIAAASNADSGSYTAVVSAPSGDTKTSDAAVVTVVPDTFPPTIVGAGGIRRGTAVEIGVGFDENVDEATASVAANYSLSKGTVTGVRYQKYAHDGGGEKMVLGSAGPFKGYAVVLTTSGVAAGDEVTVTVKNVKDVKGNAISAAGISKAAKVSSKMFWTDMGGTDYTQGASTNPQGINPDPALWPDDVIAYSESDFDLISSGTANWNAYDEATFVYEEITGDFDKVVRVEYHDPTSQWARAGMCATPDADTGITRAQVEAGYTMAQRYMLRCNPRVQWNGAAGNNQNEADWRDIAGGNYGGTGAGNPAYPNAWLRMKREGQTFTGFYSSDGKTWTSYGAHTFVAGETTAEMPAKLLVGIYYCPEFGNNDSGLNIGHSTLGRFRQYGTFSTSVPPGEVSIGVSGGNVTINWEGDGTLQSADTITGTWTDIGTTKPYSAPASGAAKYFRVRGQ